MERSGAAAAVKMVQQGQFGWSFGEPPDESVHRGACFGRDPSRRCWRLSERQWCQIR
ncbi:hypothetical protein Hanom_Chr12g01157801 [Helianthus anomalus]